MTTMRARTETPPAANVTAMLSPREVSIHAVTKTPAIKTDPGAENTLRAIVKDDKITFFINGTQIKVLRAQVTDDDNKFGFFAGEVSRAPTNPRVYTVKSYSVTEAP